MLLALDQATSAIVDGDGANNGKSRKQAAREVIARVWITIGKMWECQEIVDTAETALANLPMPSYLPDLPPSHEDLLHPPELAVDWPELELPNFGESSTSTKAFIDPEVVLRALAANEHVRNLSGLSEDEILRRLGSEWSVEIALKNCVESTQEVIRPEGGSPWIKISPAIMHIDNHSLQSISRTSREVGVGDLREALGRGGMSNAALGGASIRSLTSGDRTASVRLAGTQAQGLMAPGTRPLTGPKDVKDVLDKLGVGSPRTVSGGGSLLKASFPVLQKEPVAGTTA
ncbi:plasma membrane localization protein [Ceratobasidium sp. 394]|nr:plasma membrane localization protein [Ceratobasidium sp. 394]